MLVDVWITCRYHVSKDYSEFLGPTKQKVFWQNRKCLSVLPKHFLFLSVGPVHPFRRETMTRLYTEKLSRNWRLQENVELHQNLFFVLPQYCPPSFSRTTSRQFFWIPFYQNSPPRQSISSVPFVLAFLRLSMLDAALSASLS